MVVPPDCAAPALYRRVRIDVKSAGEDHVPSVSSFLASRRFLCYEQLQTPPSEVTVMPRLLPLLGLPFALSLVLLWPLHADEYDNLKVGVQPDGRIVVPTNQILKPAGVQ